MKNKIIPIATTIFLFFFSPLGASENSEDTSAGLSRSLEANRSLLAKYQNDYNLLKSEEVLHPSDSLKRKIIGLQDKIKALEEDSEDLRSFLPMSNRAHEFIAELMTKKVEAERMKMTDAAESLLKETTFKISIRETSPQAEPVYRMHERALQYVSERKFKQALDLYQEIVLKNPDDDEAYIIMGHSYLLTGQYQKAERAFHSAVSIDPANIHEITPFYENMILQNPDDDAAYSDLGYAYLILGDLVKAKNAFDQALSINPQNEAGQNGLRHIERLTNNA